MRRGEGWGWNGMGKKTQLVQADIHQAVCLTTEVRKICLTCFNTWQSKVCPQGKLLATLYSIYSTRQSPSPASAYVCGVCARGVCGLTGNAFMVQMSAPLSGAYLALPDVT